MTQPDKLFKQKLGHYESPAPLSAWDRIESNLDRPHKKRLWMKIAAGLTLLAIAGIAWYSSADKVEVGKQIAVQENSNRERAESAEPATEEHTQPIVKESATSTPKHTTISRKKTSVGKHESVHTSNGDLALTETPAESTAIEMRIEPEALSPKTVQSETATATALADDNPKSNVIVYTAEEVNRRFLKKNSDDATSEDKKPSGIQRLITIAADLKNTEGGFGELRDKKNEILALNFKKNNEVKNN